MARQQVRRLENPARRLHGPRRRVSAAKVQMDLREQGAKAGGVDVIRPMDFGEDRQGSSVWIRAPSASSEFLRQDAIRYRVARTCGCRAPSSLAKTGRRASASSNAPDALPVDWEHCARRCRFMSTSAWSGPRTSVEGDNSALAFVSASFACPEIQSAFASENRNSNCCTDVGQRGARRVSITPCSARVWARRYCTLSRVASNVGAPSSTDCRIDSANRIRVRKASVMAWRCSFTKRSASAVAR